MRYVYFDNDVLGFFLATSAFHGNFSALHVQLMKIYALFGFFLIYFYFRLRSIYILLEADIMLVRKLTKLLFITYLVLT